MVENRVSEGEFWISAGEAALSLEEGVAVVVEFARGLGVRIDMPRFVPPDMFDRLIGPVFLDALPGKIRRNILRMLEFFTIYLQSGQIKPSSLDQIARARCEAAARPARIAAEQRAVLGRAERLRPGRYRTGGLT